MVWKKLGKVDFAVKAPWPVAEQEDKILTRQGQFLRDALRHFRLQAGKAKKGWKKATILVSQVYPQWKIDTLHWLEQTYKDGGFPASFIQDLKNWCSSTVTDKSLVKSIMKFASFRKSEVEDVGETALDVRLPFDQKAILSDSLSYIVSQLSLAEVDIIELGGDENDVPERISENVEPGKPYLWLR